MNLAIQNCDWVFRCPKQWSELALTANESVRHCGECDRFVFLCINEDELWFHSNRLHCVAFSAKLTAHNLENNHVKMGRYLPKEYTGATMTLILEPTDFLDSAQVKFLAKAFSLGRYSHKLKEKLCDRKSHILQQNIHPDFAQQLSKQLSDRNIPHKLAIDPPVR